MLRRFTSLALTLILAVPARAQVNKSPDLGTTVPGSWGPDRYNPCGFALANGVHGRNSVLQTSVCVADAQANRPGAYSSSFYNTQGEKIGIDGVGVVPSGPQKISLDLYVDPLWQTSTNGLISVGMWSRVNQILSDDESTAWYPILNFSNQSGTGGFRYWDSNLGYQTLGATVNYGAWNTFEIDYNDNVFTAFVNGSLQYTETADPGTVRLTDEFVEVSNLDTPYTVDASNTPAVTATPEPASLTLLGTGLVGVIGVTARRRRKQQA